MLEKIVVKIRRIIMRFLGYKPGYSKNNKRAYFSIPELGIKGRRDGTDIKTRLQGLEYLLNKSEFVSESSVLDAGCAEGLISYEFYKHGAPVVHGFDLQDVSINIAKTVFANSNANVFFGQANLLQWENFNKKYQDILLSEYDIVLFLSIYSHMIKRDKIKTDEVVTKLADKAKKYFVVRSTAPIPEDLICSRGFVVEHRDPAPDANALTIFRRI